MRVISMVSLMAMLLPVAAYGQAPEITAHTVMSMRQVDFTFSVSTLGYTVEDPDNCKVYPAGSPGDTLETWTVYLDPDKVTMHLILDDPMVAGASYTLALDGVTSYGGIPVPEGYEYTFAADDLVLPALSSVAFLAPDLLDLVFTEDVIETEGENISNYSLFETSNPGNIIALNGARMRGIYDRVMLELDSEMVEGVEYTITAADLHDGSGNQLPAESELTFTYTGSNNRSLMGLYADCNRHNTAANGTGIYSFDVWIWTLPRGEGAEMVGFTMDYPSNVTPLEAELNPLFSVGLGDIYNGVVIDFNGCRYDWVWIYRQTLTVTDGLPSLVSIVPYRDPMLKNLYMVDCNTMEFVPMSVTSKIELNAPDARPVAREASFYGYSIIDILFSVSMDEPSAESVSNYEVFESAVPENIVSIASATLQADGRTVRLVSSSAMPEETEYTVRMTGIKNSVGIAIYPGSEITFTSTDTERPHLVSASMSGQHTVDILFDEPVDDATANSVLNYDIVESSDPDFGLDLHSAELQDDGVTVRLTVSSPMVDGTDYTVIASNVRDLWGNKMLSASTAEFTAHDIYPPEVISLFPLHEYSIRVFFSEVLDSATAVDLNNYQLKHGGQYRTLTSAEWEGNAVVLTFGLGLVFGEDYDLYGQNIEDPLGNAIPSWVWRYFYYVPEIPEPLIGLWADTGRLVNAVEVYPFNPFEFYVWCKPGPHGQLCAEYAIEFTSLQNFDCFISSAQYDPDYSTSIGDPYSGITICLYTCKYEWYWLVRYTAFLLDGKGYIDIVPHPLTGGLQGVICYDGLPVVQLNPAVSRITINEDLVAPLIESSSAEYNGTAIEVAWVMREMDEEPGFVISRRKAGEDLFTAIASPVIEHDGKHFRFNDSDIEKGASYVYRVEYRAEGEMRTLFQTEEISTPALPLTLRQNWPNPFNPSTVISYYLPGRCDVTLEIFDAAGKRVTVLESGERGTGEYSIEWNGTDSAGSRVSSGIYFYRLTAGKETISKKMVLLR